jgi:hypothetical protein
MNFQTPMNPEPTDTTSQSIIKGQVGQIIQSRWTSFGLSSNDWGCRDRNTSAEGWDDTPVMAQGEVMLSHWCEGYVGVLRHGHCMLYYFSIKHLSQ